jgi:flagellar hook-basal body complex protein FliE
MTSPIGGISIPAFALPTVGAPAAVAPSPAPVAPGGDGGFAKALASSLDNLQANQSNADALATQAATGDPRDVHDYMIASNEASLATEMVVTLKNKAVEAFNEIMRMPV